MQDNFKEPEEIKEDYTPFNEPVNEKSYSRPNVNIKPEDLMNDIPEPSFAPPPLEPEVDIKEEPKEKVKPKPIEPVNPAMNQLPNKEKKTAADQMANMVMQGYEWIWAGVGTTMTFSPKKMKKLADSGEVDFSLQIPYDLHGNTITAEEFINEYNQQQKDTLVVTQEFKEEVTPILSRVFAKRGVGMTDEQYLLFAFGKDAVQKGAMWYQARAVMGEMISSMKEMTAAYKGATAPSGASTTQAPVAPPPPPPPPASPAPSEYAVSSQASNSHKYEEGESFITVVDEQEEDTIPIPSIQDTTMIDLEDRVEMQVDPTYVQKVKAAEKRKRAAAKNTVKKKIVKPASEHKQKNS